MMSNIVSSFRGTLGRHFFLDSAKTVLFYYVLFKYALKAHRHVRARGIGTAIREIYSRIYQVRGVVDVCS
jgi:sphinganine-1-phosphate aldolase